MLIKKEALKTETVMLTRAVEYCLSHGIYSGSDFKEILGAWNTAEKSHKKEVQINPLNGELPNQALIEPETSSITYFDTILNDPRTK